MKNFFFGLLILTSGLICGIWLNNEKPVVVKVSEPGAQQNHIHFNQPKSVYFTFDGKAFKLSVDGEWNGLTLIHEEYKEKKE